jgi:hypothetical protein
LPAILFDASDTVTSPFQRKQIETSTGGHDEKWLQELLYKHPELVLLDQMEAGAGQFIPLRRELPLATAGQIVKLDLLGVSQSGRLVLVECKLWRNPQARREVIAQTLEYASLLQGMSYGDLSAKLLKDASQRSSNPIYDAVKVSWPSLDEARLVDAVSRSLEIGDFHLIVAGDGIRSDLHTISEHLNGSGLAAARFALLEIQLWVDGAGRTLVAPNVPVRTQVIQQRVFLSRDDRVVRLAGDIDSEEEAIEREVDPDQIVRRQENRRFWQTFIDTVEFDHPDQPLPRHGGDNWVRIPLPAPMASITAYRNSKEVGFFRNMKDEETLRLFRYLAAQADAARAETDLELEFRQVPNGKPATISVKYPIADLPTEEQQLEWLRGAANRLVTFLRPAIVQWVEHRD